MSTRANIIIKDDHSTLFFYRHSDGYIEGAGEDLKAFVKLYTSGVMRLDVMQSAGWLIVRGHFEYKRDSRLQLEECDISGPIPDPKDKYSGWKVGAYEPTSHLHRDVEYIYIIDLKAMELTCRIPKDGFGDNPTLEDTILKRGFKVRFGKRVDKNKIYVEGA